MLDVRHLTAAYGQHPALQEVTLSVSKGEIVVILGANGAGKSTLLRSIAGICKGEVSGEITLSGKSILGLSSDDIVESGIALVPEGRGIFGDLTVKENLMLGAYSARARSSEGENLEQVLTLFPKLGERQHQIARTMSGGEQQMVAIGRAMMSAPDILMLDEPSLGLAPLLCKELFQNLKRVKQMQIGILLVEQNARQSLAIANRGYLLENTRITHEDTADRLATDPVVQKAYLGGGVSSAPARPASTTEGDNEVSEPAPSAGVFTHSMGEVRRSADQQIGASIDDLVAKAAHSSATSAETSATVLETSANLKQPLPSGAPAQRTKQIVSGGEVRRITRDIETAARNARSRVSSGTPRARPIRSRMSNRVSDVRQLTAPTASAEEASVPVIEVYKRPRVEVYRRRPGGEFERD